MFRPEASVNDLGVLRMPPSIPILCLLGVSLVTFFSQLLHLTLLLQ
jgi:hypothetical protein